VFEDETEAATVEDFRNTWGLAVGGDYRATQALTLRTGLIYEKTPTRDAHRSTRIPDTDRLWASIGASYAFSSNWSVDISYMHLFVNSAPVTRDNEFPALATSVETLGITHTSSNVVGLGLQARF
jgi:long-chain fatty acid transport protein